MNGLIGCTVEFNMQNWFDGNKYISKIFWGRIIDTYTTRHGNFTKRIYVVYYNGETFDGNTFESLTEITITYILKINLTP